MATAPPMASDGGKLSFAKVAASASKKGSPKTRNHTAPAANLPSFSPTPAAETMEQETPDAKKTQTAQDMGKAQTTVPTAAVVEITCDIEALRVTEFKRPDLVVNGIVVAGMDRHGKASHGSVPSQPSSDDVSQKADSEFGTKPPSLDGKSITSGTTFNALDEKESLRPDDSASVKAAADEDDAFSVRGSLVVNSRLGSDTAPRIRRIQIGDMPPSMIAIHPEPAVVGVVTPRSLSSEQQPVTEARVQLATSVAPPDTLNGQSPDEKLLDAMQTPKDRLFLLRLESDVVNFVQNSKEPFMDLPPSNSFCRMLTHKLADYYHMTHSFEAVAGSVRIFRTPFCRVPPPLASLVTVSTVSTASTINGSTPLPLIQPKKIMRRGEDLEILCSAGPSMPNSEDGSDSKDKGAPAKETLSREAREEAYNKARERIFGSSMTTEATTPENEDGTGVSRASSVSAKDKVAMSKKAKAGKQRRDDSESFDSRSQYTPYYTHLQQATWIPPQYILPAGNVPFPAAQGSVPQQQSALPQQQVQQAHQIQAQQTQQAQPMPPRPGQPYANTMQPPLYSTPTNYPPAGNGIAQTGTQFPQPACYPSQSAPPPSSTYYAPGSPANMPPQPWQQPPAFVPGQYPSPPGRSGPLPASIPYAFGQLPANANPHDPKSQHPIPGSYAGNYNRHAFNPQTQSFVPANGPMPVSVPGPPIPYGASMHGPMGGTMASGKALGPNGYGGNGYQSPAMPVPMYGESPVASYGMMRQTSGSSVPPYAPVPAPCAAGLGPHLMAHGPPMGPAGHARGQVPPRGPNMVAYQRGPHGPVHNYKHYQHGQHSPNAAAYGPQKTGPPVAMATGPMGPVGPTGAPTFSYLPNYGNPATLPQKPAAAADLRH